MRELLTRHSPAFPMSTAKRRKVLPRRKQPLKRHLSPQLPHTRDRQHQRPSHHLDSYPA
ncbi:hypothetical protein BDW72DRAFT_169203 [Aspergillus terricola var. indicus]